jgi:hypothetical protein
MKGLRLAALMLVSLSGIAGQAAPADRDQPEDSVYVGVLEIVQHDRTSFSQLRYAFVRERGSWQPIAQIPAPYARHVVPAPMSWFIVEDGRVVETVQTTASPAPLQERGEHGFAQVLESPLHGESNAPGNRTDGAIGRSDGRSTRRALAVTRKDFTTDPDHWASARLAASEKSHLMVEMRKRIPQLPLCDDFAGLVSRVAYGDNDVDVLSVFRDAHGRLVVGMRLNEAARDRSRCGNFMDFPELDDIWLLVGQDGATSDLGSLMTPVGAADLDGDGSSEWVFNIILSNDTNGYRLFHEGLTEKVDMIWAGG